MRVAGRREDSQPAMPPTRSRRTRVGQPDSQIHSPAITGRNRIRGEALHHERKRSAPTPMPHRGSPGSRRVPSRTQSTAARTRQTGCRSRRRSRSCSRCRMQTASISRSIAIPPWFPGASRPGRCRRHVHSSVRQGRMATFRTPSRRLLNRSYALAISSSVKRWVISGVGSNRPDSTIRIRRSIRSLPPGQSVVTIV